MKAIKLMHNGAWRGAWCILDLLLFLGSSWTISRRVNVEGIVVPHDSGAFQPDLARSGSCPRSSVA